MSPAYSRMVGLPQQDELFAALRQSGIPYRFWTASFETLEETPPVKIAKQYAAGLKEHVKTGSGILLRGPVGTGKTITACAIAIEAVRQGMSVKFVRAYRLVDDLDTFRHFSDRDAFEGLERAVRQAKLLILDDFGLEKPQSWAEAKVESIVSHRYDECLPTVITTNLSTAELKDKYSERVIDRIAETCAIVTLAGESRRRKRSG